jgi:sortase (surface protein transpeptidase)
VLSGHDDIYGSIFRYLGWMRHGDVIRVWEGRLAYRDTVTSVQVVAPTDVRLPSAAGASDAGAD